MEAVFELSDAVGWSEPELSNTTSLEAFVGVRSSRYLLPVPTPEPVAVTASPVYAPLPVVLSVMFTFSPVDVCPLPASAFSLMATAPFEVIVPVPNVTGWFVTVLMSSVPFGLSTTGVALLSVTLPLAVSTLPEVFTLMSGVPFDEVNVKADALSTDGVNVVSPALFVDADHSCAVS